MGQVFIMSVLKIMLYLLPMIHTVLGILNVFNEDYLIRSYTTISITGCFTTTNQLIGCFTHTFA